MLKYSLQLTKKYQRFKKTVSALSGVTWTKRKPPGMFKRRTLTNRLLIQINTAKLQSLLRLYES